MVQRRTSNFSSHQLYAQFNNCACILSSKHMILSPQIASSSVQFSCSVVSDSLRPHELQHARLPCPSPTPGVYSNSCPLSQWCHSIISRSVIPFSYLQSFPASGSFRMSRLFHQVAKVLELQVQYQSYQWIFRTAFL